MKKHVSEKLRIIVILVIILIVPCIMYAQDEKTVTITTIGSGATPEVAKQNALRNAIEQAFGTFISSNTEILNDELIKDEIVSVANGNIQNYEVISETEIPDIGYATTIKATVSVSKLTSFVESKGMEVEIQGGLFAENIKLKQLYEQNEYIAIENLLVVIDQILAVSFDYSIDLSEPKLVIDYYNYNNGVEIWKIDAKVSVRFNENIEKLNDLLYKTLPKIGLTKEEAESYKELNRSVYYSRINLGKKKKTEVILRSEK